MRKVSNPRAALVLMAILIGMPGCIPVTLGCVAAVGATVIAAAPDALDAADAIHNTITTVKARRGVGEKVSELRRQVCLSRDLRGRVRADYLALAVAAGVPEDRADTWADGAARIDDRACGQVSHDE